MSEHSEIFEKAKEYYDKGWWKKKAIKNLVKRGYLTEAEYLEITGEEYSA